MMAGAAPSHDIAEEERDIWEDTEVLHFILTHKYHDGLSAKTRDRIYRRAESYRWMGDGVMRLLPGGVIVVVPRPAHRQQTVDSTHQGMGHFGVQRVLDRLRKNYWWRNMGDLVVRVIQACHPRAKVKAGFRESGKELQPLPVRGLGYRWGVDFAEPLPKTKANNTYVMVCIEHFTKWVEPTVAVKMLPRLSARTSVGSPKPLRSARWDSHGPLPRILW